MEGSYSYQVSREGRVILQSLIININNWLDLLTDKVINKAYQPLTCYTPLCNALRRERRVHVLLENSTTVPRIRYATHSNRSKFFQKLLWPPITKCIV